jgi:hypothetical protein
MTIPEDLPPHDLARVQALMADPEYSEAPDRRTQLAVAIGRQ